MKERRKLDQYFTPETATQILIARYPQLQTNQIIEPCAGARSMARLFPMAWTYDYDLGLCIQYAHRFADARIAQYPPCFAYVTNPPFCDAWEILMNLLPQPSYMVAMFLRLSFLEPTHERGPGLAKCPPDHIISCPRISFTGDGLTDNVNCAWMVWHKDPENRFGFPRGIEVCPRRAGS